MNDSSSKDALRRFTIFGYFLVGTVIMIFPPLMTSSITEFGLSLAAVGLFFPAKAVGGMFGGFLIGAWSDLIGRNQLFVMSSVVLGGALLGASLSKSWILFLLFFMVSGIAQSAVSTVINAITADINQSSQSKGLNTLHAVYGLGAAVGPLLSAWMLSVDVSWRIVLMVSAGSWIVYGSMALFFTQPRRDKIHSGDGTETAPIGKIDLSLFKHELFALLVAIGFIYNGISMSLLGWVSVYLEQSGVTPFIATSMIPVFYVGMTGGRFVCARFSEHYGYGKTILVCAIGTAFTYPIVAISTTPLLFAIGVFLSGLFISGLYPTAIAFGSRAYPALAGTIAGGISVGATLGMMIPPWWTGLAADTWSFQIAVAINFLFVIPLCWIAYRLVRHERTSEHLPPVDIPA